MRKLDSKSLTLDTATVKWIPVKAVIKIEQSTRQIGGIWKMIDVPTFFFYTENVEKYEVFPATDKQKEIEKYTNIILKSFDSDIVKSI